MKHLASPLAPRILSLTFALVLACSSSGTPAPTDASLGDGAADGPPVCPGPNPASSCPSKPGDCVPSGCSCAAEGWACTADCGTGGPHCRDAAATDTAVDDAGPADLCTRTGGTVGTALCCLSASAFPGSCSVGACGCAPSSSHSVVVCSCPDQACFDPARGCVIGDCTPGMDQTCNDSTVISSLRGQCQFDRTCTCTPPSTKNPATGRCL